MKCDIIIVCCNQLAYTRGCLQSIEKNTAGVGHRVIIVDNASDEETKTFLRGCAAAGGITLIENTTNQGWVDAVNTGLKSADAEFVCVMNNDTVVYPGWLEEMIRVSEKDSRIGLVNPEWRLPRGFRGERDDYFTSVVLKQRGKFIETAWVRGFCFLVTRAVIQKIGGLDPVYSPGYYDDGDYSIRAIQAGFLCVLAQGSFVWHFKNITAEDTLGNDKMNALIRRNRLIFHEKWGFHQRIIFFTDPEWDKQAFKELLLELLRDQHRIRLVACKKDAPGIEHEGLRVFIVPRLFLPLAAWVATIFNARHANRKKFHIIACNRAIKGLLVNFTWVIRDFYRFFVLSGPADFSNMEREMSRLKYKHTGGH